MRVLWNEPLLAKRVAPVTGVGRQGSARKKGANTFGTWRLKREVVVRRMEPLQQQLLRVPRHSQTNTRQQPARAVPLRTAASSPPWGAQTSAIEMPSTKQDFQQWTAGFDSTCPNSDRTAKGGVIKASAGSTGQADEKG